MVEFEEIKDEHYDADDGFETDVSEGEFSDTSSTSADDQEDSSLDTIQDETLLDRIIALKDIIPATQRNKISKSLSNAYSYGSMATFIGGKAAYIIITSVLVVLVPFALANEEDRQIGEQERQMQLQQGMSEV